MLDIAPLLKSLGFLESEMKVYLAAIERGPSTVIDLSGLARLSRPATYTAIEALRERGLMSQVAVAKKRLYAAEHPDRLVEYARRRSETMGVLVRDLERALPEIMLRVGGQKPVVKSFEGREGIQAIIDDMAKTRPKEMAEMTNIDAMRLVVQPQDLKPMREALDRIGTKIRALYAGSNVRSTPITDARVLPPEFSKFRGDITVYENKVAIVTFAGKFHSIIIEDAAVAETMRTLFDMAWRTSEAFPKAPPA